MAISQFRCFLGSKLGLAATVPLAVLAVSLFRNNTGEIFYALPFVFLLACPLMHLFGHRHGHHNRPKNEK